MPDLDLEFGDPERAEEPRRTRRSSGDTPPRRSAGEARAERAEADRLDRELHVRITAAFGQIAEWRQSREDFELAEVIIEDRDKMANGLVSATHVITPARKPLVIFLGFIEPVLAFGRVGRILVGRWFERRQRRAEELAAAQAQWDAEHDVANVQQPTPFSTVVQ